MVRLVKVKIVLSIICLDSVVTRQDFKWTHVLEQSLTQYHLLSSDWFFPLLVGNE